MENVRFFYLNVLIFYSAVYKFDMNRILVLAVLTILVTSSPCKQGELLLEGSCQSCGYIPGCAKYYRDGECDVC